MSHTMATRGRLAQVLLVEDSDDDAELLKIGLAQAGFTGRMHHVTDGIECLAFLRKQGAFAGAPMPDLILLDMNLPRMSGLETLAQIVSDEHLRHLPVLVLSSSTLDSDLLAAYRLRCSTYIVKPVDFADFTKSIRLLIDYWFTLAALPPESVAPHSAP